jgi:hypothetical protein
MDAILGGKSVTGWACNAHGMPTFRADQTDYPEIEAQGRTPAGACDRLVQLRVQALDFASEAWRCQPLAPALSDACDFDGSFTAGARTEPRRSRLPSM